MVTEEQNNNTLAIQEHVSEIYRNNSLSPVWGLGTGSSCYCAWFWWSLLPEPVWWCWWISALVLMCSAAVMVLRLTAVWDRRQSRDRKNCNHIMLKTTDGEQVKTWRPKASSGQGFFSSVRTWRHSLHFSSLHINYFIYYDENFACDLCTFLCVLCNIRFYF